MYLVYTILRKLDKNRHIYINFLIISKIITIIYCNSNKYYYICVISKELNNTKMIAKIKTKSNYRQLNGTWLAVTEIVGKRVTCKVYMPEINKFNNVDFNLNEIEEFNTTIQIN